MASSAIEAEGLVKEYPGDVRALDGLSFAVEEGTVFGLLGPNGAGKSTAVRILTTLARADEGSARVAGHDVRADAAKVRSTIGVVAQRGGADREATARENLRLSGRLHGLRGPELERRIDELLDRFGLGDAAERIVRTFSGGMERRLDIGLALVHRPRVLFLDEPTTGLDPQARARMWDEIRGLRESGTTVFLTTHYLEEADALADRLAIIDHGRIVAEGTGDELKRQVAGDVITIGVEGAVEHVLDAVRSQPFVREASAEDGLVRLYVDGGDAAVPQLIRVLDGVGLQARTLTLARPSLDDVFLRQTGRSLRERAD